jgi:CheY-like chemotaxis protein
VLAVALIFATFPWLGAWAGLWLAPWTFALGMWLGQHMRAEQSRAELETLKSRLAHEINNPLAIVIEQLGSAVGELERKTQSASRSRSHDLTQLTDAALCAAERIAQVVRALDDRREDPFDRPARARSGPVPTPIRLRVLIIDDEPQVAVSLKRLLRRHEVEIATTGFEALNLLATRTFDVVVSDVMMPEPSGVDVYERIARTQPALARRFVFVSGGSYTARAREFLASIPNMRLAKPVDAAELEHALAIVHGGLELDHAVDVG